MIQNYLSFTSVTWINLDFSKQILLVSKTKELLIKVYLFFIFLNFTNILPNIFYG